MSIVRVFNCRIIETLRLNKMTDSEGGTMGANLNINSWNRSWYLSICFGGIYELEYIYNSWHCDIAAGGRAIKQPEVAGWCWPCVCVCASPDSLSLRPLELLIVSLFFYMYTIFECYFTFQYSLSSSFFYFLLFCFFSLSYFAFKFLLDFSGRSRKRPLKETETQ